MKIKIFLAIFFLFFLSGNVWADDVQSSAQTTVQLGNFSHSEGNTAPYANPGVSGSIPQSWSPNSDRTQGLSVWFHNALNNITPSELRNLASSGIVSKNHLSGIRLRKKPERIYLLDIEPSDKIMLGWAQGESAKGENAIGTVARLMYNLCLETNADYFLVFAGFSQEGNQMGYAVGLGIAKNLNGSTAASTGGLIGGNVSRNFTISDVTVYAYGGIKPKKIKIPPTSTKKIKKTIPGINKISFSGKPIFFDFDVDVPNQNQENSLLVCAKFIGAKLPWLVNTGKTITFVGHCDVRGGEDYNAGLGLRRAKNVAGIIAQMILANKNKKDRNVLIPALEKVIHFTSAGKNSPDFKEHKLNRRVDMILVDKNLTLPNIGGQNDQ